jgi:hypothetical protein
MRYGRISSHLNRHSILYISIEFAMIYCVIAIAFGLIYYIINNSLPHYISFTKGPINLTQSIYFSFVAQLTSGYGDIVPTSYAQSLAVFQGIFGMIFTGIWVGILVVKWFTAGDRNSILFARWAGYSIEERRFFILFVNRNEDDLVDVNINAVLKLKSYDSIPPWTFAFSREFSPEELGRMTFFPEDGIKVSISGTAGLTRCMNWHKYGLDSVFAIPSRSYYWSDLFTNPRFDDEFFDNFSRPCVEDAMPFLRFIQRQRQI